MNTAISEIVIEMIVKPISREPFERRGQRILAFFHVAEDVFQHDDRVVDHQADRQGQRHQRQIVEAIAEHVDDGEGADQRRAER